MTNFTPPDTKFCDTMSIKQIEKDVQYSTLTFRVRLLKFGRRLNFLKTFYYICVFISEKHIYYI